MLSRGERIEKMINLLTDNTRQLIMTVRELNTEDELLSFMQRDNMIICNDLFNYIFTINDDIKDPYEFTQLVCSEKEWVREFFRIYSGNVKEFNDRMMYYPKHELVSENIESLYKETIDSLLYAGNDFGYKAVFHESIPLHRIQYQEPYDVIAKYIYGMIKTGNIVVTEKLQSRIYSVINSASSRR